MLAPLSADEYQILVAAVGWPSRPADVIESSLRNSLAIVTERDEDGSLVGMARAVGDGLYVFIVDVVVAPYAQSRGLGRRLVRTLLHDLHVEHAPHLALFAAPDVAKFYEVFGFAAQPGSYMRR